MSTTTCCGRRCSTLHPARQSSIRTAVTKNWTEHPTTGAKVDNTVPAMHTDSRPAVTRCLNRPRHTAFGWGRRLDGVARALGPNRHVPKILGWHASDWLGPAIIPKNRDSDTYMSVYSAFSGSTWPVRRRDMRSVLSEIEA